MDALPLLAVAVASFNGQTLGWYKSGEGAGLIGAVVGAIILFIWGLFTRQRASTP
jgi:uncharacterized membrane protein YeaQ/YmgE (transglycosylase-associated protein family)